MKLGFIHSSEHTTDCAILHVFFDAFITAKSLMKSNKVKFNTVAS